MIVVFRTYVRDLFIRPFVFFSMFLSSASLLAQIQSYPDPVVYVYDYTDTDGIKTIEEEPMTNHWGSAYVVVFRTNVAVIAGTSERSVSNNKLPLENLSGDLEYLSKPKPSSYTDYHTVYKYTSELSTKSNQTYRSSCRRIYSKTVQYPFITEPAFGDWEWKDECFSFSNDKERMILWYYDNPVKRVHFKRVFPKTKTEDKNLDFLN